MYHSRPPVASPTATFALCGKAINASDTGDLLKKIEAPPLPSEQIEALDAAPLIGGKFSSASDAKSISQDAIIEAPPLPSEQIEALDAAPLIGGKFSSASDAKSISQDAIIEAPPPPPERTEALDAATHLEKTIKSILDVGAGTWDRHDVLNALAATDNVRYRAIEHLCSVSSEKAIQSIVEIGDGKWARDAVVMALAEANNVSWRAIEILFSLYGKNKKRKVNNTPSISASPSASSGPTVPPAAAVGSPVTSSLPASSGPSVPRAAEVGSPVSSSVPVKCAKHRKHGKPCPEECVYKIYYPADKAVELKVLNEMFGLPAVEKLLKRVPADTEPDQVRQALLHAAEAWKRAPATGTFGISQELAASRQEVDALRQQLAASRQEADDLRQQLAAAPLQLHQLPGDAPAE
ncbi:hypothetical protein ACQ4PT_007127 [Festuca glaucescens]